MYCPHPPIILTVPLDISLFSLNGVSQINEVLKISENMGFDKPEITFLITIFDSRSNFSKGFLEKAKKRFGVQFQKTVIR